MIWLGTVAALAVVGLAYLGYLAWYFQWESQRTAGMAYYGLPLAGRRALKRRIRTFSLPVRPLVRLLGLATRRRATMPAFEYQGVSGPVKVSSAEVFARATQYAPRPEDVFVVTQMRCGTTWMQQVVYEIVTRGQGDFNGHDGHLYAISPWIDAVNSVSMQQAPLVGDRPTRIIKSHLPTDLCPYSPHARYIYVARHPVSCFASIVDFNRSMIGPLLPPVDTLADWFCSDRMYWGSWPRHVNGWWQWAQQHDNVLFVHFEEMKRDFGAVRDQVAMFLGCTLTAEEQRRIDERCSFRYMQEHEESFEMAPPTMFSVTGGKFMARGTAARHEDVSAALGDRILTYCRESLRDAEYPASLYYPDFAVAAAARDQ
jgi:hypothetical protein